MMKPNLFLVGVAKAGTSAIHQYLSLHPDIGMSRVKEPHYFSNVAITPTNSDHATNINNLEDYLSLFPAEGPFKFLGESSPSYIWDQNTAKRIYEFNPSSKIILILRDPIGRAFSHYNMDFFAGRESHKSFIKALKQDYEDHRREWGTSRLYIELGFYFDAITRFMKYFDKDAMGIFYYEEVFDAGGNGMKTISDFLGLPAPQVPEKVFNAGTNLTGFGKLIKSSHLTSRIPGRFKNPFKKLLSKTDSKPQTEAIQYLLHLYKSDVQKMRDELNMPFYYQLFKTRYDTDLDEL